MRVGVVTTSYPRHRGDLAGAFVADRVTALLAAGHDVDVIAAAGAAPAGTSTDGRLTVTRLPARLGAGPERVGAAAGGDLFGGAGAPETLESGGAGVLFVAARFTAALAFEVRARAATWSRVESHWLAPCALAVAAGAPGLPHRATAHSGDVALLERLPLGDALARRLAGSGADLVFVSEALRARFAALAGRACGVVEDLPVPSALFPAGAGSPSARGLRLRARLGLAGPTVVSVGRFVPIKGYDLLVRACAAPPSGGAALQLVLVGDGPEGPRLRRLAAALGVPLALPGRVPRHAVAAWLGAADLYAQPSRVLPNGRTEGLPMATLEALASGLPAVVSDSGGLAELAARPRVRVVPAGRVSELRAALRDSLGPGATSCVAM